MQDNSADFLNRIKPWIEAHGYPSCLRCNHGELTLQPKIYALLAPSEGQINAPGQIPAFQVALLYCPNCGHLEMLSAEKLGLT